MILSAAAQLATAASPLAFARIREGAVRAIPVRYVSSWIKALKHENNELFRAIADAPKAAQYLLAFEHGQDAAEEVKASFAAPARQLLRLPAAR